MPQPVATRTRARFAWRTLARPADIFNITVLKDNISPFTALSWQRAMAANLHAGSGRQWTTMFAIANSGTAPNQWMILDSKALSDARAPGANVSDLLWVAEQMPGLVHSEDLTPQLLGAGYWASYNLPYFADVYNKSGYPAMEREYGDAYSWANCPRARIFRRNATQVSSLGDMQALMRYNDYQHDPLSKGDPMSAVSSRGDLATPPVAFGAYDAKVIAASDVKPGGSLLVHAVSGPTTGGGTGTSAGALPPFSWDAAVWHRVSHVGQPDTFDFDWTAFAPST